NNQKLDSELPEVDLTLNKNDNEKPEVDLTLNKNDNEREFDRKENDWSSSKEQWDQNEKLNHKPILADSSNSHLKRYETDEISQLDILSDNEENDKHKQTK
ncbi:unnamed protein product, partial [Brachionus calyciflorus]